MKSGNQVFLSGQLPLENGELKFSGKVGLKVSVEDAKQAAKIYAINLLEAVLCSPEIHFN